ncbi:MAG: trypsin-like peptidase domain-containing protein [Bryobacteraceae bacterium]
MALVGRCVITCYAQSPPAVAPADVAVVPRLTSLSREFRELARKVNPAVVRVSSIGYRQLEEDESDEPGIAARQHNTGSGVIIDPDGYVVTNAHVVLGAQKAQVTILERSGTTHGREGRGLVHRRGLPAEIVGLDVETDIALLKVPEKGLPALRFADSDTVEEGQFVFAVGSPMGLDNSITMGVISSTARQFRPDDPMVYLQTDASINPGSSGGPLVDAEGNVVGISTMILTQSGGSEGLGFAVPSTVVANVVDQLRQTGKVVRGEIGVRAQAISPALARGWRLPRGWGVVVGDVDPDSAAASAGLQVGDVIEALDGRSVETARQFSVGLYRPADGATVRLDVLRGGQKLHFDVRVREKNDDVRNYRDLASREENLIPELGVFVLDLTPRLRAKVAPERRESGGVLVAAREAEGPVFEDNFQSGDVIYAVNREQVKDVQSLRKALRQFKPGDALAIQIERDSRLRFISFELP